MHPNISNSNSSSLNGSEQAKTKMNMNMKMEDAETKSTNTNGNGKGNGKKGLKANGMSASPDTDVVRKQIAFVLNMYPGISVSMLQIGVGTYCKPVMWKPVMQAMIEEGLIEHTQEYAINVSGQQRRYAHLTLTEKGKEQLALSLD